MYLACTLKSFIRAALGFPGNSSEPAKTGRVFTFRSLIYRVGQKLSSDGHKSRLAGDPLVQLRTQRAILFTESNCLDGLNVEASDLLVIPRSSGMADQSHAGF
jgi:hypothetical protein